MNLTLRWSIRTKLTMCFVGMTALIVFTGLVALKTQLDTRRVEDQIHTAYTPLANLSVDIQTDLASAMNCMHGFFFDNDATQWADLQVCIRNIRTALEQFQSLSATSPAIRRDMAVLLADMRESLTSFTQALAVGREQHLLAENGRLHLTDSSMRPELKASQYIREALEVIARAQQSGDPNAIHDAESLYAVINELHSLTSSLVKLRENVLRGIATSDPARLRHHTVLLANIVNRIEELCTTAQPPHFALLLTNFGHHVRQYQSLHAEFLQQWQQAAAFIEAARAAKDRLLTNANRLTEQSRRQQFAALHNEQQRHRRVQVLLYLLLGGSVLTGIVLCLSCRSMLLTPLTRLEDMIATAAAGQPVSMPPEHAHDETGSIATALDSLLHQMAEASAAMAAARATAEQEQQRSNHCALAMRRFLFHLQHALFAPLHSLDTAARQCMESAPPALHKNLTTVRTAAAELLTLTDEINDVSRLESGTMLMSCEPFSLAALLERTQSVVRQAAADKHLELTCVVEPGVPDQLVGDPMHMGRILHTLLHHAVSSTDYGSVHLLVQRDDTLAFPVSAQPNLCHNAQTSTYTLQLDGAGHLMGLYIRVQDTGRGMHPAQAATLFTHCSNTNDVITRMAATTDSSLIIVQCLVHLMRGTIWVESEPDKGCTIHLALPCAAVDKPAQGDSHVEGNINSHATTLADVLSG